MGIGECFSLSGGGEESSIRDTKKLVCFHAFEQFLGKGRPMPGDLSLCQVLSHNFYEK